MIEGALSHQLLDALAERLSSRGDALADHLMTPLPQEQAEAFLAPLALCLPPEARTWWSWHNGVHPGAPTVVAATGLRLLSVEQAIRDTELQRVIAGGDTTWWPAKRLVLMSDLGGDVVTIEAPCSEAPEISPVYFHIQEAPNPRTTPSARSIGEMVRWWIDALDTGAYEYDPSKRSWTNHFEMHPQERALSNLL